jgi:YggT family protein
MEVIDSIIRIVQQTLVLLVIVKVFLSYFMDPFHPVRQSVDRLVEPLLQPIRRMVPTIGQIDISPIILIILIDVAARILRMIF